MISARTGERGPRSARSFKIWGAAAVLMLLPVLAVRGVDAAAWHPPGDFMFLAILLAGLGIAYEIAVRVGQRRAYAAGVGLATWTAMLNIWINLAVGIIGSEDHPANWMYAAVIAVAALGALLARLSAAGMARAMLAAALAQVLVFALALIAGLGFTGPITVFFTGLWLIAAWLFRRASAAVPEAR